MRLLLTTLKDFYNDLPEERCEIYIDDDYEGREVLHIHVNTDDFDKDEQFHWTIINKSNMRTLYHIFTCKEFYDICIPSTSEHFTLFEITMNALQADTKKSWIIGIDLEKVGEVSSFWYRFEMKEWQRRLIVATIRKLLEQW